MPAVVTTEPPTEPGSLAWHLMRKTGIGGSDVAPILGLSPWQTSGDIYDAKTGEPVVDDPATETDPMHFGKLFEPLLRQEYANRTGRVVMVPPTMRSVAHPFMLANLDGLARDANVAALTAISRPLEIKTARSGDEWGEPGTDQIPVYYFVQVQHYLAVTGLDLADLAVLIGGSDFRVFTIEADRDFIAELIETEARFWRDHVLARVPPAPVSMADARRRWGSIAAKGTVIATEKDLAVAAQLAETKALLAELEKSEDAQRLELIKRLGDEGDTLVHPVTGKPLATWKLPAAPKEFDAHAFERDHPQLYREYLHEGRASRRFLLKVKGAI